MIDLSVGTIEGLFFKQAKRLTQGTPIGLKETTSESSCNTGNDLGILWL